jgi:hypothetical protein
MKTSRLRPVVPAILAVILSLVPSHAAAFDPAGASASRQRLHQQQLQDRLSLETQQNLARNRAGLYPSDKHRLDRLELNQRIEQQRLEMEQMVDFQRFSHDPARARIEQHRYDVERALQLQRFYVEQQRVLGTVRPEPLQPAPEPGQLRLP